MMINFIFDVTVELFKKYTNLLNDEKKQENFLKFAKGFLAIPSEGVIPPFEDPIIVLEYFHLLDKYLSALKANKIGKHFRIELPESIFLIALILANKIQTDTVAYYLDNFVPDFRKPITDYKEDEKNFKKIILDDLGSLERSFVIAIDYDMSLDFKKLPLDEIKNHNELKATILLLLNDAQLKKKFQQVDLQHDPLEKMNELLSQKIPLLKNKDDFEMLSAEVLEVRRGTIDSLNPEKKLELFKLVAGCLTWIPEYLEEKFKVAEHLAGYLIPARELAHFLGKDSKEALALLNNLENCITSFMSILVQGPDDRAKIIGLIEFFYFYFFLDENNPAPPATVRKQFYPTFLKQVFKEHGTILHVLASDVDLLDQFDDICKFAKETCSKEEINSILNTRNAANLTARDVLSENTKEPLVVWKKLKAFDELFKSPKKDCSEVGVYSSFNSKNLIDPTPFFAENKFSKPFKDEDVVPPLGFSKQ